MDLLAIALAFLVVAVSPGPANLAAAATALRSGRAAGLLFGAGLGTGLALWGLVAATGLGALLQGSATLLAGLKFLGGLYLFWLAIRSGRESLRPAEKPEIAQRDGRWFLRGLALNLANPKAVFAWMAALSMGLGTGGGGDLALPTALCMAIGFANYAGYALAFSLPGMMAGYRRLARWIDGVASALFAAAGLGLIRSALAR